MLPRMPISRFGHLLSTQTLQANGTHFLPRATASSNSVNDRRHASSSSPINNVVVDQTKKNNDPSEEEREAQSAAGQSAGSSGSSSDHPAKQADPQKPPERSTGFETRGPQGEAGEGKDTGDVHQEKKSQPGPHQSWEGEKS